MAFDVKSGCVFVLLLTAFQQVIAKKSSEIEDIRDCSQCSARGGHWCSNPLDVQAPKVVYCSETWIEGWCTDDLIAKDVSLNITENSVSPKRLDQSITVGVPHRLLYTPTHKINMKPDTQLDFKYKTDCKDNYCYIEVIAGSDFCQSAPTFVNMKIDVEGLSEAVVVSYRVSCSCQCSAEMVVDSPFCNFNGNRSCGACVCKDGWVGNECNQGCEEKRGDQSDDPCIHPAKRDVKCSGNGVCGPCQECKCLTEGEGAQYFYPEQKCLDLCSYINYNYDECIWQTEYGKCLNSHDSYAVSIQPCNATILEERDNLNRSIWVRCSETAGANTVEYSAKRTANEFYIMKGDCYGNNAAVVVGPSGVKVPVIVCLVLAAAAAAVAAGYLVWRQRAPPPVLSAQLDNFDAENCTGRNPLYKPPTSFFKNPTYGKL